jgi:hypothetical protein
LGLVTLGTQACKSSDKEETESVVAGSEAGGSKNKSQAGSASKNKAMVDCNKKPDIQTCCQAMTPNCNECRKKNKQTAELWENACLADNSLDCKQNPPIKGCCNEATDECRTCRDQAIFQLVSYKEKCGSYAAHTCEAKPPLARCEASYTPSAVSCRNRNNRILEEWRGRCAK